TGKRNWNRCSYLANKRIIIKEGKTMKLTYNRENTDDVLLVTLRKAETPSYEYLDGVTVIKDGKETIGLNIFNAGERIQLPEDVSIKPSEAIVGEINNILSEAGTDK